MQNDCLLGLFGLNDTGSDYMFQIYKKDNKHGIIAISVVQHYVERAVLPECLYPCQSTALQRPKTDGKADPHSASLPVCAPVTVVPPAFPL